MKRTFATALLLAIAAPLSANAVPIAYEFSGTIESISYASFGPIPPEIQAIFNAFIGAPVTGSFRYESEGLGPPVLTTPGVGNVYNGAVLDYAANIAGFDIASPVGSVGVQSVGQDRLVVSALAIPAPPPPGAPLPAPPLLGHILGYESHVSNLAWVEGIAPNEGADSPIPDGQQSAARSADL